MTKSSVKELLTYCLEYESIIKRVQSLREDISIALDQNKKLKEAKKYKVGNIINKEITIN